MSGKRKCAEYLLHDSLATVAVAAAAETAAAASAAAVVRRQNLAKEFLML